MRGYWIELIVDGSYYWLIKASNGEVVCQSENYLTKWNARRAAKKMHKVTGLPWFDEIRFDD